MTEFGNSLKQAVVDAAEALKVAAHDKLEELTTATPLPKDLTDREVCRITEFSVENFNNLTENQKEEEIKRTRGIVKSIRKVFPSKGFI
jgi:hypothetical protein